MELVAMPGSNELTIVSPRLLRVETSDWDTPEEVFRRIQGSALEMLLSAASTSSMRPRDLRVLLLLDCMLRVLGEPTLGSAAAFGTPRFRLLQKWFYGALGSEKFISVTRATRLSWAEGFYRMVERLNCATHVAKLEYHQGYRTAIPHEFVLAFERQPLHASEVLDLRPYLLKTKTGLEYNVLLSDMVPVLGRPFTEVFHAGLCVIARPKAKDTALRDFGTTFARFVAHRHSVGHAFTPALLRNPTFVQTLLVDFMEYHFLKMTRRREPVQEATLSSLQKLWSRYSGYWHALVRQGILAAPAWAFPAGNTKLLSGGAVAHRRVARADDGSQTVVTNKLLLPVPLHMTDEQATELLFKKLRADFTTTQSWLRQHLLDLFAAYDKGCAIAASIKELPEVAALRLLRLQDWRQPTGIGLAVKYIKQEHGGYVDTSAVETVLYPNLAARDGPRKHTVSRLLGLPTQRDAMVLMAFLASSDGRFTEASLSSATLLDSNGRRVNAVETDGGLILSVLKERDAGDGWHNVSLNGEAATFVRRWIQQTEPLRTYMREKGLPGWRNLIVYAGSPLGKPGHFNRASNIHSAFRLLAHANRAILGDLADQVTIPRIRSTRGVLVFLETMDLASMARELGNSNETSLRHYLPDSLWDYFATRWLRVFQNLLIVAATKDTPYMQRALRFSNVAELDEFLRNHAVAPLLPADETPPVVTCSLNPVSEVMVPASTGLFTMLLSISAASEKVERQGRVVAARALYWVEFTQRLKAHIESDAFHDRGVKRMMATAVANSDSSAFEGVVCA